MHQFCVLHPDGVVSWGQWMDASAHRKYRPLGICSRGKREDLRMLFSNNCRAHTSSDVGQAGGLRIMRIAYWPQGYSNSNSPEKEGSFWMSAWLNPLGRTAHYGRITKGIQAGKNNQCQVKQFRGFLFWDTMYRVHCTRVRVLYVRCRISCSCFYKASK